MKITAFKNYFFETLAGDYPAEEVGSFFNILTVEYLGLSRLDLALNRQRDLSSYELERFEEALQRLRRHEPIQYITGSTEFFGSKFHVNKNTLIPRPETEELVQWILEDWKEEKEIRILDIGTGSGCIAVALAKHLRQAKVSAIDISEAALRVAEKNAGSNGVNINFIHLDILAVKSISGKFDVIVSNPPYVRELEKIDMQRNVLEHEPHTALYVKDEDPLLFYRKISDLASNHLNAGGKLYFEINQYLGNETAALLAEKNFQTRLKKDIFGVHRMLRGVKL